MTLLRLRGVTAHYGGVKALFGVDLDLRPGEVLALVGPNGAGKSTLLKAVIGLVDAEGEMHYRERDIAALPTHCRARLGLGYVPEERRVFTDLTVRENLLVGRYGRPGPWTDARLFELFPNLAEMQNRPAAQMSGGEQQMLAIARTLAGNPDCVLLDEASEGLAPRIVEAMAAAVITLKQSGVGVLLSEQNAHFAEAVADRSLRLENGRLTVEPFHDTPQKP